MPAMDVYYEMATKHLDAQMSRVDSLDTKVAALFAASTTILTIFAGLLSLTALPSSGGAKTVIFGLLGVASGVYIGLLRSLFKAYGVGSWSIRPHIEDLQSNCANYDEQAMKEWVADECVRSVRYNAPLLERKADYLNNGLKIFPVEAFLLVLAGAVTLLTR